eukprot:TRINITY_DN56981_c0_g1_i1.p1 TRINITY_DN56981_c0_g1~~TRINITY_DN56981_c0_g1_i1.p1  ORF type:complete len:337 (-),score=37.97 TRINITY_DN56981_c0_g1_i1:49-1059(-)
MDRCNMLILWGAVLAACVCATNEHRNSESHSNDDCLLKVDASCSADDRLPVVADANVMLQLRTSSKRSQSLLVLPMVPVILAALVAAVWLKVTGKSPSIQDSIAACTSCVLVVVVGNGIWGDMEGGHVPLGVWFGWHPVLMTTSFLFLMVLGRYSYVAGASQPPKRVVRGLHGPMMISAVVVMLMGYAAIVAAHFPDRKFFGYDFKKGTWGQDWLRILHVYLGYAAIILALAQATMGAMKHRGVQRGERLFTFHGTMGKLVIANGGITVLTACSFWKWGILQKSVVVLLTIIALVFGTLWPISFTSFPWTKRNSTAGRDLGPTASATLASGGNGES